MSHSIAGVIKKEGEWNFLADFALHSKYANSLMFTIAQTILSVNSQENLPPFVKSYFNQHNLHDLINIHLRYHNLKVLILVYIC